MNKTSDTIDPPADTAFRVARALLDGAPRDWVANRFSLSSEQIETADNEGALSLLLAEVLADSLGFAAAKMTRRVIGAAHVEDLESITNADERAIYEKKVLAVARALLLERKSLSRIEDVTEIARTLQGEN